MIAITKRPRKVRRPPARGWAPIEIADARKVKAIAPLARETDRADARVLADLARRDRVTTAWVPALLDDRAMRANGCAVVPSGPAADFGDQPHIRAARPGRAG